MILFIKIIQIFYFDLIRCDYRQHYLIKTLESIDDWLWLRYCLINLSLNIKLEWVIVEKKGGVQSTEQPSCFRCAPWTFSLPAVQPGHKRATQWDTPQVTVTRISLFSSIPIWFDHFIVEEKRSSFKILHTRQWFCEWFTIHLILLTGYLVYYACDRVISFS